MPKRKAVVVARSPDDVQICLDDLTEHETDALCRVVSGMVGRMKQDPKLRAEYEAWKRERKTA